MYTSSFLLSFIVHKCSSVFRSSNTLWTILPSPNFVQCFFYNEKRHKTSMRDCILQTVQKINEKSNKFNVKFYMKLSNLHKLCHCTFPIEHFLVVCRANHNNPSTCNSDCYEHIYLPQLDLGHFFCEETDWKYFVG